MVVLHSLTFPSLHCIGVGPFPILHHCHIIPAAMGWSSWNVYAGGVDEQKIMGTIDAMALIKDAGYE